ncbi:hypothetical protein [Metamycoplasma hominis]|uniref:hypothetical protein n=1 Tax=Metamycoplasma hominis TaxID=2098 RepID=UPI001E4CBF25|nr:hypothetical protein [Metamycoplasma hominis]
MCLLNFVSEIVFNNWTHNEMLKRKYLQEHNIKLMDAKQVEDTIRFCAVIVDEAHLYIDPDNPAILKYMVQMTKTVRKFNAVWYLLPKISVILLLIMPQVMMHLELFKAVNIRILWPKRPRYWQSATII